MTGHPTLNEAKFVNRGESWKDAAIRLHYELTDALFQRDEYKHAFEVAKTAGEEALAADRAVERALGRLEAIPEGWKLVPVEPTEAMLDKVDEPCAVISNWWGEMLSAAPEPPKVFPPKERS